MSKSERNAFRLAAPALLVAAGLVAASPAWAQEPAPSPNATINLINLMVKRGLITRADADGLIKQAEAEASAAAPAPAAAPGGTTVAVPNRDGTVRVQYVPEMVRKQIRDEVRTEVMAQAKREGWATPNAIPDWTQRIKITGDIRLRYEGDYLGDSNANTGEFPNFNAINTGSPYDVSTGNANLPPQLNVDQDRERARLRARLGVAADLGDGFSTGLRVATGDGSSPVSTNQSLGGSGGNFSKYAIWLDRAYIRYKGDVADGLGLVVDGGRFDNPFFATDLIWDDDIGFDGLALAGAYDLGGSVKPFGVLGAFPVYNTDFNFASTDAAKMQSHDKWLLGGQAGVEWKITDDYRLKAGLAYYHFDNIKGELSSLCTVLNASDACDSDLTRPGFAQKGNTYMALRAIAPTAANGNGTTDQYQYFGLVTGFRELALTARLDLSQFKTLPIALDGEYVKNLAFDESRARANAVNNRGDDATGQPFGEFEGGDTAYMARLTLGTEQVRKRWDWNLRFAYKYLESDSVVDGFTDSDFGLGGTNLEGYVFGGAFGVADNVALSLRWQSADNIAGPTYSADVLQADVSARF
ncbi:MAG: putative porin [Zavarzinia sp.]|nr:putative porin [Zavarzinia sp.]